SDKVTTDEVTRHRTAALDASGGARRSQRGELLRPLPQRTRLVARQILAEKLLALLAQETAGDPGDPIRGEGRFVPLPGSHQGDRPGAGRLQRKLDLA